MKQIMVLVTEGKHESVDRVKIMLFNDKKQAVEYCNTVATGHQKHWIAAEIVEDGEIIELEAPDRMGWLQ